MAEQKAQPKTIAQALVMDDTCPKCFGELDTGWECNDCGYDAINDRPAEVKK